MIKVKCREAPNVGRVVQRSLFLQTKVGRALRFDKRACAPQKIIVLRVDKRSSNRMRCGEEMTDEEKC